MKHVIRNSFLSFLSLSPLLPIMVCASALILTVSACSILPKAAPTLTQYDLGGSFPQGASSSPIPLYSVNVIGQPLVASTAMNYRETANPTQRGTYLYNRWATTPAHMVETALTRLLAINGTGTCHLEVRLTDFIVEVTPNGGGQALISSDLRLADMQDKVLAQHIVDVRVPLAQASPTANAQAMREATQKLGENISTWLGTGAGKPCTKNAF